jgi:pimeloyl-ACP methyl ester carboxylesterase
MPYAQRENVKLYYDEAGPADGIPLILVHGLGTQLISWYPEFVQLLVDEGFRVIRFDNRDVGLSTHFDDAGEDAPYSIHDMADDAAVILDELGIDAAHFVGVSMGGMIVQQLAIDHPERVKSLISMVSTPNMEFRLSDPEVIRLQTLPRASSREEAVEQWIARETISGLVGWSDERIEAMAGEIYDRDYSPEGMARQSKALSTAPDRVPLLRNVTVPAAVISGRDDRLLSFLGGVATAEAIPGADLHIFKGMGHQVKPELWNDYIQIILRTVRRAS